MNKKLTTSLVASFLIATNLYSNENLDQITVSSATKSEQSIKDVTSNINVITKEELDEKNFISVKDALNTLTGISFTSNGGVGKATSVRLRGFDPDRVLVLIDGARYNDITSTSGASIESLLIDDIEQIEVIKGAQSGIWGADATAGVINIITSSAKKGTHGSLKTEIGSFQTKKVSAKASYRNDDFYLKVSHLNFRNDGFSAKVPYGEKIKNYEKDGYLNKTTKVNAGLNINENNNLDLIYTLIDVENEADSFSGPNTTYNNTRKDKYATVKYENRYKNITTNVYYNRSEFNRYYPTGFTKEFDGIANEYGIKSNVDYNKNSFFVIGAEYKDYEHKSGLNEKYNSKAIFLTNSNKFNDKLVVTESLRYDKYSIYDNKLTGKIGAKYNFTNDLYVASNIGTAYNVPTPYEKFGPYKSSTKEIQPDTTKSADISLGYKNLKVTYFYNRIKDMKSFDKGVFKYTNLEGTSKIQGVELEYKKDITPETLLSLNYTRNIAEDNEGYKLERVPTQTLKFGLDYYGIKNLHLGAYGEYIGDRVQYVYGTHNVNARTGNYTVWNAVANYKINSAISTYFKVDNVFDKYYQTVNGYASAPRSFYAGLKVDF